jgi:hypothetical protein
MAVLAGALAVATAAQESRPASQPFLRIGERTTHPWPLSAKERLWVVTADLFVCDATSGYFLRTSDTMRLLGHVLGMTLASVDGSAWARTHAAEWAPLRKRLQEAAEAEPAEQPAEDQLIRVRRPDTPETEASARRLRALIADPLWKHAPFPREALDPKTMALWRALHELVRALWGETDLGWPGWLTRLATEPPGNPMVSRWPNGEGVLPRVPDLLSKRDAEADSLLDAPAWGASGVFTDFDRTTTHLRSALVRLTEPRGGRCGRAGARADGQRASRKVTSALVSPAGTVNSPSRIRWARTSLALPLSFTS